MRGQRRANPTRKLLISILHIGLDATFERVTDCFRLGDISKLREAITQAIEREERIAVGVLETSEVVNRLLAIALVLLDVTAE